jgi:hypothetical protein
MGVVPAQDPGPGKAKTKIEESNAHAVKPTKGKKLKPSRGKSIINSLVLSKVKGQHHVSVAELFHCKFHQRNNRQTNMDQNAKSAVGHEYRQAQSTNKVRVCTAMIYSPWYVDGTHMWLGAIYIPCRQSFTPVHTCGWVPSTYLAGKTLLQYVLSLMNEPS